MRTVLSILLFAVFAGLVPVLTGLLPCSLLPAGKRTFHRLVITGYMTTFALFEVLGLPVLFFTKLGDFYLLLRMYLAATAAVIVLGIVRTYKSGGVCLPQPVRTLQKARILRKNGDDPSSVIDREALVLWIVFWALLVFEIVMAITHASYDGDDSYYVAQSVQTYQTGTMYHYIPYTGITTSLDGRHAMALLPMWISAVSVLCRLHPAIVSHTLLPVIFLPLADISCYSLMRALLYNKVGNKRGRRMIPAFLVILAVAQIFGNNSIYTPESFLMLRTWQGKTLFACVVVPVAFYVLLNIAHHLQDHNAPNYTFLLMFLLNVTAGFTTSMAPFYLGALLVLGSLMLSAGFRKPWVLGRTILCCIPNAVYAVILVILMLPNLLA